MPKDSGPGRSAARVKAVVETGKEAGVMRDLADEPANAQHEQNYRKVSAADVAFGEGTGQANVRTPCGVLVKEAVNLIAHRGRSRQQQQ